MKVRLSKTVIDEAVYEGPGGCYLWDLAAEFRSAYRPDWSEELCRHLLGQWPASIPTIGQYGGITRQQAGESARRSSYKSTEPATIQPNGGQRPSQDEGLSQEGVDLEHRSPRVSLLQHGVVDLPGAHEEEEPSLLGWVLWSRDSRMGHPPGFEAIRFHRGQ